MNKNLFNFFLHEDAPHGDITTRAVMGSSNPKAEAQFLAKQDLVLSGVTAVFEILRQKFPRLKLKIKKSDGANLKKGMVFAFLHGPVSDILLAERLCLNLLQHLSGIATLTARYVAVAKKYKIAILDTRKTTPGLRHWEKQAVRDGGGVNHRTSLSDQYLIKDNHITAAGSVTHALTAVLRHREQNQALKRRGGIYPARVLVEIEIATASQLREALPFQPDIILLDNMTPRQICECVKMRGELVGASRACQPQAGGRPFHPIFEISGGITLKNLKKYVCLGIERISVGALTHSAPAVDISMKIV